MGNVMIHINEELSADMLDNIEGELNHLEGVENCYVSEENRHLMLLSYDGRKISSPELLHTVAEQGVHAQLIGF